MLRLLVFLTSCLVAVYGHGYLIDPVARSSAWMVDQSFKQCCTYSNHMEMFCGGIQHQWNVHKGKCSICGEAYDKPNKLFEKGGSLYLGKIVKTYRQGEAIEVKVVLTANHKGYFEFRLCNLDNSPNSDATQECLDRRVLKIAGTGSTRFGDVGPYGSTSISVRVQLPSDVACRHCVFQWKYTTGNNWGTDPVTGQSGSGMGVENETFMGCSDISIVGNGGVVDPPPVIIPPTNPPQPQTQAPTRPPTQAPTQAPTRPPSGATTWSPNNIQYRVGDSVLYDGKRYVCVHDHVSFPGAQPSPVTWAWWKQA